jgi:hypothetical protein
VGVALADLGIVFQAGGGEIAASRGDLGRHQLRADHQAAAVVAQGGGEIERGHADRGGELHHAPGPHAAAKQVDQVALLGKDREAELGVAGGVHLGVPPWAAVVGVAAAGMQTLDHAAYTQVEDRAVEHGGAFRSGDGHAVSLVLLLERSSRARSPGS